ncbi:unnamed protein product [Chrysoparadoxa australica]
MCRPSTQECSKNGKVLHCYVDAAAPGGLVYVMFKATAAAKASAEALQGRWFAGRMVTVDFMPISHYTAKFPETSAISATIA